MANQEELFAFGEELIARAIRAGADQAEVAISAGRSVETSLESDAVHTVQTTDETIFGLRVFRKQSLGFSTANTLDEESVDASVGEAIAQASAMPADACNRLPQATPAAEVPELFDQRIADMTVEDTAALARRLLDGVRRRDQRLRVDSGGVSGRTTLRLLLSSEGVRAAEASSAVEGYLFGMAVDGNEVASFDYDGDAACRFDRIELLLDQATERFTEKCLAGLGARSGRSFRGAVVLSPEAVGEFLLSDVISAVSADAVRKGRSPLADKFGKQIAVPGLTVVDNATAAGAIGSTAFDREGVATSRYTIIENGVLRGFLSNHYEALATAHGAASTGPAAGGGATRRRLRPIASKSTPAIRRWPTCVAATVRWCTSAASPEAPTRSPESSPAW